jgi:ATP-dependent DNA helicase RecG
LNSPEFVRFIERLGADKTRSFSTYDFLALDILRQEEDLPAHLRSVVPGLVATGAIEAVGRGRGVRYILARGLYAALNSKGTYTRRKGLDRATNKELLLKHIRDNASTGAQMGEFRQVLPTLTRDQVRGLLRELQGDHLVHTIGATKAARWFPGPRPIGAGEEGEPR